MAGEFANFFVRLGSQFDPKGLKKADTQIKKTDKAVTGIGSSFKKLGAMFIGGAAIWKMVSFAKSSADAFAKQQEAVVKLNQALKSNNQFSAETSAHLQDIASEIQKVTTVGDETTIGMMQLGLSMGIAADEMEVAMKQTIGLSKAYGVDLNASMKMVALARQGEFTMLNRYIPQLRALKTNTEKAAMTNKLLAAGFEVARAETRTYAGQVEQLGNAWGDVKEKIFEQFLPAAMWLIGWLRSAVRHVDTLTWAWAKLFSKQKAVLLKKELEELNSALDSQAMTLASNFRWQSENTKAGKEATKIYKEIEADIKRVRGELKKLTAMPPGVPFPGLPGKPGDPAAEKEKAEKRLETVDKWYNDAKGIEMVKFYQWLHETEIAWDTLSLEQKEATMEQIVAIHERANTSMAGSFVFSIHKMQAAGLGWAKAWDGMWGKTLGGMTTAVDAFFSKSEDGFLNLKKFLDSVFKSVLRSFAQMVTQMIAKWLLLQAVTGLFGGKFAAALMPSRQHGGPIEETGPVMAHKGEFMLTAGIVNAIKRGTRPPAASSILAGAGGGPNVVINQTNNIGSTEGGGTNILEIMEGIKEATKDGIAEALDMSKEVYNTGAERVDEA